MKESFLTAISKTFKAYNTFGARSNKKLIPVHKWFAEIIESKCGIISIRFIVSSITKTIIL